MQKGKSERHGYEMRKRGKLGKILTVYALISKGDLYDSIVEKEVSHSCLKYDFFTFLGYFSSCIGVPSLSL